MSQVTKRGPVAPAMNITPLIDVVFLLIIFFMIVSKIASDENAEMLVPEFDEAKTREIGEMERVVVNVVPGQYENAARAANPLELDGTPAYIQIGANIRIDNFRNAPAITEALKTEKAKKDNARDKNNSAEVEVLLRADRALYYRNVQPVMGAISSAGIETVNLVAIKPEDQ